MIVEKTSKLFTKKRVGRSALKNLFCSHYSQVLINPPMASNVLSEYHFAEVIRLLRNTFYFCEFCDTYVNKEQIKNHESTRDQIETAETHLGYFYNF